MMVVRICILFCFIAGFNTQTIAQRVSVKGKLLNEAGEPVVGASIHIKRKQVNISDTDGAFSVQLQPGKHVIQISSVGYRTLEKEINTNTASPIVFTLEKKVEQLQEISVQQKAATQLAKEKIYAVDVLDFKVIRNRNLDMNRLLDAMPGIRVRESGGLGSAVDYSINGLSGKAIRFFLDGIPMTTFGGGFAINNFPAGTLERIEIYKGVTPIELSSDVLGGAINLITRKDIRNYIDASYTIGSFGTHKLSVDSKWRNHKGFTVGLSGAWNYSKNNYEVWGNTVEVADSGGRPLPEKKYRRFNDDFNAYVIKAGVGFINTRWADQFMLELAYSNMERGIQTGRTMAYVYGDVRYKEDFVMSSLRYNKKNLFTRGLHFDIYAGINRLKVQTIDTGSNKYNWAQDIIATVVGESDGIRSGRSMHTFKDNNIIGFINSSYKLKDNQTVALSYSLTHTYRKGSDPIGEAEWTIPYRYPQYLTKQITGLSYQLNFFDEQLSNLFFVKNFNYAAGANIYDFNGGAQKEVFKQYSRNNSWGLGYGVRFKWTEGRIIKLSAENTTRIPDAEELFGNGSIITSAPGLVPEQSLNINVGIQQQIEDEKKKISIDFNLFYRNVRELIWLGEATRFGKASYENIHKIRSAGFDIALRYSNKKWFSVYGNASWQDVRNRQKFTSSGASNLVYNDRMKNMPAFMANGEVRFKYPLSALLQSELGLYIACKYIEGFYLTWPKWVLHQQKVGCRSNLYRMLA